MATWTAPNGDVWQTALNGMVGVPYYSPTQFPPVVHFNLDDGTYPFGVYQRIEIPNIPLDTSVVDLAFKKIITMGNHETGEIANLEIRLRRPLGNSNAYLPDYIGQSACIFNAGGVRDQFDVPVAVENCAFEIRWDRTTTETWPDGPSYGLTGYCVRWWR